MLIDAHDQADAVLQILVDEGHPVANTEVGTTGDLRWWSWPGAFDVRWCRASFGRCVGRFGEDRRVVHFEGLAVGSILYGTWSPCIPTTRADRNFPSCQLRYRIC